MTSGLVLAFRRQPSKPNDWAQQELAEFYRVESALLQGGLSVITDHGCSDEGDPWFVFCRADNEEVIAHIARIDGEYVIVSSVYSGAARGPDFRLLLRRMIEAHPLMMAVKRNPGQKIFLHPAALLTAMLASAYFLSSEKELTSGNGSPDNARDVSLNSLLTTKFSLIAAVALAAIWFEHQTESVLKFIDGASLFQDDALASDHPAHLAAAGHDATPFDAAIMQALGGAQSASFKIDSAKANLQLIQDAADHANGSPTAVVNSSPQPTLDTNKADLASGPMPLAGDQIALGHSDVAQNDYALVVSDGQLLMPMREMIIPPPAVNQANAASSAGSADAAAQPNMASSADAASQSNATPSAADAAGQPNATPSAADATHTSSPLIAATNAASQLVASEIGSSSTPQILVLDDTQSLNSALQQVLSQNGFKSDQLQSLSAAITNSVSGDGGSLDGSSQAVSASGDGSTSSTATQAVTSTVDSSADLTTGGTDTSSSTSNTSVADTHTGSSTHTNTDTHPDVVLTASEASIERIVETFLQTTRIEVIFSGENVVIIDTNVADANSHHYGTVTWDLSDGSTLTIVGVIHPHELATAA